MKTADLTGAQLDYWVAKAIYDMPGHEFRLGLTPETAIILRNLDSGKDVRWQPSTDGAQGEPIIEREGISLLYIPVGHYFKVALWRAAKDAYNPQCDWGPMDTWEGPTALIAAMRAFVASKFGDEVPDAP